MIFDCISISAFKEKKTLFSNEKSKSSNGKPFFDNQFPSRHHFFQRKVKKFQQKANFQKVQTKNDAPAAFLEKSEFTTKFSESNRDETIVTPEPKFETSDQEELQPVGDRPVERFTQPSTRPLYIMLFVLCFFSNGFMPSISTYVAMPYGPEGIFLPFLFLYSGHPK